MIEEIYREHEIEIELFERENQHLIDSQSQAIREELKNVIIKIAGDCDEKDN